MSAGIDDQIKDAQDVIDKEVADFNERHDRKNDTPGSNGGELLLLIFSAHH